MDIIPKREKVKWPKWDITPRPPVEFEVRLIIWDTEDVTCVDYEGCTDMYIRAYLSPHTDEAQETDTHYRCQNGKGSFNWRMKFPLIVPSDVYRLTLQIYDRDLLSENDFISDATITFGESAEQAWVSNKRVKREGHTDHQKCCCCSDKGDPHKFWVQTNKQDDKGETEKDGRIRISLEICPIAQAEACPVGEGRENPNIDPFLPPPTGRIEFSWNPCVMAAQMCGPGFRCKLCCCLYFIICCACIIMIGPMLLANLLALAVGGNNKNN